jgi:2-methylcitrate dehydratase PrpD
LIRALAKKVKVFVEPKCSNAKLGCAEVKIRTKSGGEYTSFVPAPKGYPQNPLTKHELEEKFKSLALSVLTENRVVEVLKAVESLEEVSNVRTLMDLVRV